jgi:hypothetical protein
VDGGNSGEQTEHVEVGDPANVRTKGCGSKNSTSEGPKNHIKICRHCRHPGHNITTCPNIEDEALQEESVSLVSMLICDKNELFN